MFEFERFEERLEVSLAEALRTMPLDDLDEHGGAVLDRLAEDLEQVAFIVPVDQDAEIVNGFHILVDLADALR